MILYVLYTTVAFIGILALLVVIFRFIDSKLMRKTRYHWGFIGYLAILLVAFGMSYVLPENEIEQAEQFTKVTEDIPNLYNILDKSESIPITKDYMKNYLNDEWTFDFSERQLNLEMTGEGYMNNGYLNQIVVEKTDSTEETIEAALYVTPLIIKDVDVTTHFIPKTKAKLYDSTLTVHTPSPEYVEIGELQKPFPVRQFTEQGYLNTNWEDGTSGFGVEENTGDTLDDGALISPDEGLTYSTELLYLKVPSDVDVVSNNEQLYIVNVN